MPGPGYMGLSEVLMGLMHAVPGTDSDKSTTFFFIIFSFLYHMVILWYFVILKFLVQHGTFKTTL